MLYYKGHKILGVNFLPRYTLAQYTALSVKPHYWIRTDAPFRYTGVITTLDDLSDVEISNPTDKQVLTYNATSQKWENKDAMGGMLPQIIASTDTGSTVVATKGGTTISLTETSTGVFECVLYNGSDTYGEWTLTATLNGDTKTTTVDVDTVKIYTVAFAPPIPDGSTVLPTDDIEILLNCANIFDSPITTLSELLADSTTLETVINDNNAIDYLVRSTTFASSITADSSAMTDIGANNYASDTLLADSTWLNAIVNSTYIESVLNVKIPTMTSNTAPSGECIANSSRSQNQPYSCFDSSSSTYWLSSENNTTTDDWLGYDFGKSVKVHYVDLYGHGMTIASSSSSVSCSIKMQAYNGSDWVDITEGTTITSPNGSTQATVPYSSTHLITGNNSYNKYRLLYSSKTTGCRSALYSMQCYGRQDV